MYFYDGTLNFTLTIAAANFASQAAVALPNKMTATRNRTLETAAIQGVAGVIGTAGTATISIGDGTTAARYGTFVATAGLTAGQSLTGTLTLTEEGTRMGMSNIGVAVPNAFVLTFSGTAVINQLNVITGYF